MRARQFKLFACCLLIPTIFAIAQHREIETTTANQSAVMSNSDINDLPFTKGNFIILASQNAGFSYSNKSEPGQNPGYLEGVDLNVGANYMVVNNFGLGFDFKIKSDRDYFQQDNSKTKWMGSLDILYGNSITNNLSYYIKGSAGIGSSISTDKSGSYSTTMKENLTGYNIEAGVPLRLYGDEYFTPYIAYNFVSGSYSGEKETNGGPRIGFKFETYLGSNNISCDRHNSLGLYLPGNSFIDYTTSGSFGFGTINTSNSGSGGSSGSEDYSCESVCLDYKYYIFKDIALGGRFEFDGSSKNEKEGDYKITTGKWLFGPGLEFNAPLNNGWNNLFADIDLGFGSENNKTISGSSSTSSKINVFNYQILFGFNDKFSRNIAFVPKIGLLSNTYNYTDTKIKENSSGLKFEFGLRFYLGSNLKY
jgi:hypothetical protein